VGDRAALAKLVPDRVRVGDPRGVSVIEVSGPVPDWGVAVGHGSTFVRSRSNISVATA
jgi:hypothetical protein